MLVARHQRITQLGQEVTDGNSRIINVELEDALMISQAIEAHEHEIYEKGSILMAKLREIETNEQSVLRCKETLSDIAERALRKSVDEP